MTFYVDYYYYLISKSGKGFNARGKSDFCKDIKIVLCFDEKNKVILAVRVSLVVNLNHLISQCKPLLKK